MGDVETGAPERATGVELGMGEDSSFEPEEDPEAVPDDPGL